VSRKSRIRIRGNDRALMMLCRDARRRWMQYGENRGKKPDVCPKCEMNAPKQSDHIIPLGGRPRDSVEFKDLGPYLTKMFNRKCQWLCEVCHKKKTHKERKRR